MKQHLNRREQVAGTLNAWLLAMANRTGCARPHCLRGQMHAGAADNTGATAADHSGQAVTQTLSKPPDLSSGAIGDH
jgi:hypothetical protein